MALKATIFKADLQISDLMRNHYGDHSITLARHPSENDERMMVRLLAFCLHADDALVFGEKIGSGDEPDLWKRDLTGAIDLWIDVGQPDEKQVRKACGRARQVFVYAYGGNATTVWWEQTRSGFEKQRNLTVSAVPAAAVRELAKLACRTMALQCTIQDGQVWMSDGTSTVSFALLRLKEAAP